MNLNFRIFIITVILTAATFGAGIEPAPGTYVEDRAGVLDNQQKVQLIGLLQELEQKTKARLIVLTVDSTDGEDIQQYAFERADTWKFGANQKSASVLIVVAVGDRQYRIEVGYDWEGILPDGYVGQVGRDYFVPNFKAGRYGQGLFEATAVIAQKIAGESGVSLSGMPDIRQPSRGRRGAPCCGSILPLLFILLMLGSGRRNRGMLFWGLLAGTLLSGNRHHGGGGFGGGGFGGGGFGGFGGGGGGGFGGGG
ncbi:MAG: TPM domain-containing protein, partial [Sedimentisphaerales bacterium]|nr:TPM domain-containing protein [Sedimentisphaerales bacterium]